MDIPKSKGHDGFWEAYRGCAEENRVRPDRSPFYVNWAKDFANFLPEKPLKDRSAFAGSNLQNSVIIFPKILDLPKLLLNPRITALRNR